MIEINLLPAELRPTQPTPWPKLLGLLGVGLVLLGEALTLVYYHFNLNPTLQDMLKELETELKNKTALAARADSLREQIEDYKLRAQTIIQIRDQRILWAKKLDQIIDVIPDYVWLSGITVSEGLPGSKAKGPIITLNCFSLGSDEKRISGFLRGIKNHPLGREIESISDPSYTLTQIDREGGGKLDALRFTLTIELKPKTTPPPG